MNIAERALLAILSDEGIQASYIDSVALNSDNIVIISYRAAGRSNPEFYQLHCLHIVDWLMNNWKP